MTRILDGKRIARGIEQDVAQVLTRLDSAGHPMKLVVVLVGNHPASVSYVRGKQRAAERVGLDSEVRMIPDTVSQTELLETVDALNRDAMVDAILVQLPLPGHIDETAILEAIAPEKDVDGFHPVNAGRNVLGYGQVWPCTPSGILEMLRREDIPIAGKHAVVVGRSNIVGKPMSLLLVNADATVTVCHSKTLNVADLTRQADILVAAVGRPHFIQADWVKDGAVVIDVGINRVDGKLLGDVDFEKVAPKAAAITPVPGGVGPLTIAMLMQNTLTLGLARRGLGGMGQWL